jgi:AcrR family transcriptional regulator
VKEVAYAAGIKAPGLYSHFTSREAILTEAVSRVLADFMHTMESITEDEPESALRETVRRHVLYQLENKHIARVADLVLNTATAGHFLSPEDYEVLLAVQREHLDLLRARIAAFAPDRSAIEVDVTAMAIIAMGDRVAIWFEGGTQLQPERLADMHWDLARAMLS